jgi:NifB/MoaA-like Fe-S oxidoreductase
MKTLEREGDRLGDAILIPSVSFKDDEDVFLDDVRLHDLSARLNRPTLRVESTARGLMRAVLRFVTS